jgi:hypothetical protein
MTLSETASRPGASPAQAFRHHALIWRELVAAAARPRNETLLSFKLLNCNEKS